MFAISPVDLFFLLTLCHLVSDYLLQTDAIATKKSGLNRYMFAHIGITGIITFIPLLFFHFTPGQIFLATALIYFSHYLIDITRSYVNHRFLLNSNMSPYWKILGVDQILHLLVIYYVSVHILAILLH